MSAHVIHKYSKYSDEPLVSLISSNQSPSIQDNITLLASNLLGSTSIPTQLLSRCMKYVRYIEDESLSKFNQIINSKIRQKLMDYEKVSSNVQVLARFDKEYDKLKRVNPTLLSHMLVIFESLSFQTHISRVVKTISTQKFESVILPSQTVFNPDEKRNGNTSQLNQQSNINTNEKSMLSMEGQIWIDKEQEVKLMMDLLYIFQGIHGRYIKYDPRSETYAIDPTLTPVPPPTVTDIIYSLCEVGWLYEKIQKYISRLESSQATGLIAQAFVFALQEELHDFYRLLAVLEQEFSQQNSTSQQNVTLLRLRAWMQEPAERMYLIACLVDSVTMLSGGALLSKIHGHGKHGDTMIATFIHRIMDAVSIPFYHMLTRWLLYGDLQDLHEEFFIGMNSGTTSTNQASNVWLDTYHLRQSMLPTFLPLPVAMRILVIGKTINFIRICYSILSSNAIQRKEKITILPSTEYKAKQYHLSHGYQYDQDFEAVQKEYQHRQEESNNQDISHWLKSNIGNDIEDTVKGLQYGKEMELIDIVQKIGKLTDDRLLYVIEQKYFLNVHLSALKKYMLLGQGDFVTCLMDIIGPELKKRSNQLYRHNLTGMLESALRSSNAQYDPSFVLDRIGVRLLESVPGDTGWEVFSLDYKIDTPLNAIIHNQAIAKYRTAFHMYWRLKRVEWSLSSTWKQMTTFLHVQHRTPASRGGFTSTTSSISSISRDGSTTHFANKISLPGLHPIIHLCTLYRSRMTHFINNLCNFLMFEVLEAAWCKLTNNLQTRVRCLDDIIKFHDEYLQEILDKSLLSPVHEQLNIQIQELLQCILRFCTLQESLIADAMASIARLNASTVSLPRYPSRTDDAIEGVPLYVITRIQEAIQEYNKKFDEIMRVLKNQSEQGIDLLRHLTFRLDFNEYHALSQSNKNQANDVSMLSFSQMSLRSTAK